MKVNQDTSFLERLLEWLRPFFAGCVHDEYDEDETFFPTLEAGATQQTQDLEREYNRTKQLYEQRIQNHWKCQYGHVIRDIHTYWRIKRCKRRVVEELDIKSQRKRLVEELNDIAQIKEEYVLL